MIILHMESFLFKLIISYSIWAGVFCYYYDMLPLALMQLHDIKQFYVKNQKGNYTCLSNLSYCCVNIVVKYSPIFVSGLMC